MTYTELQKLIKTCPDCGGVGAVLDEDSSIAKKYIKDYNQVLYKPCSTCSGKGKIIDDQYIEIDVPEGYYFLGQIETHVCEVCRGVGNEWCDGDMCDYEECNVDCDSLKIGTCKRIGEDFAPACTSCNGNHTIETEITGISVEQKDGKYYFKVERKVV